MSTQPTPSAASANRKIPDVCLFMQFLAFGNCMETDSLIQALEIASIPGVLYADISDSRGVGLLTFSEDANFFVGTLRTFLNSGPFASLRQKSEFSMLGRTYVLGHEPDYEDWLLRKPRRTALNPDWPWAVWYPLRRKGEFARLSPEEQKPIMREHGMIGHSYGEADLAHDIRLACHGLDGNDNDFVLGIVGKKLAPISTLVETMRKTVQTSQYIQNMGPFFIGKAVWRAKS